MIILVFNILFVVVFLLLKITSTRSHVLINKNSVNYIFNINMQSKFNHYKVIILVIFTSNIYEQLMNFYLTSVKRFNITEIIFLALDRIGYNMVKNILPNVYMSFINQNISQHIDYNTPLYWKIVFSKTLYVKMFIDKNYDVILCDADVIFFKDPRIYMLKYNTDLVTTCDHYCPTMNSGL